MSDLFADITTDFFKILWTNTDLIDALETGDEPTLAKMYAILERKAPDVESHMKVNAPWTDRTGNARQGLAAQAFREDDNMGIVLYHQVPYGYFLEVRWSGRYAIILPTIEVMGPEVMKSLENILKDVKIT